MQPRSLVARLRVKFDAITKNRVLDPVKGHECALEKLAVGRCEGRHAHDREAQELRRR